MLQAPILILLASRAPRGASPVVARAGGGDPMVLGLALTRRAVLAARRAGFLPERRISCPMDGAYLPQHVRRARTEGRLLGQVRDLLVMRKPSRMQDGECGMSQPEWPFDLF